MSQLNNDDSDTDTPSSRAGTNKRNTLRKSIDAQDFASSSSSSGGSSTDPSVLFYLTASSSSGASQSSATSNSALTTSSFKQLLSRFKSQGLRVILHKQGEPLLRLSTVKLLILVHAPQQQHSKSSAASLSDRDVQHVHDYVSSGGSLLVLGGEKLSEEQSHQASTASTEDEEEAEDEDEHATGDSTKRSSTKPTSAVINDATWLNPLLSSYGLALHSNSVIRTIYSAGQFDPRHCLVASAACVPSLKQAKVSAAAAAPGGSNKPSVATSALVGLGFEQQKSIDDEEDQENNASALRILYPQGCSIAVSKPAIPLLTSGALSFPAHKAIAALSTSSNNTNNTGTKQGKVCVVGSSLLFSDEFIQAQDNNVFVQHLMQGILLNDQYQSEQLMQLSSSAATAAAGGTGAASSSSSAEQQSTAQASLYAQHVTPLPDTETLAQRLRCCLMEQEEISSDFMSLFDMSLYEYSTRHACTIDQLYTDLEVKHEPLALIPPAFEVPLPQLQPALLLPTLRELPPPALDLYDLDAQFSSEKLRLAVLTNKCVNSQTRHGGQASQQLTDSEKDVEYYVRESGDILGIMEQVRALSLDSSGAAQGAGATQATISAYSGKRVLEYVLRRLVEYKKIEMTPNANSNSQLS